MCAPASPDSSLQLLASETIDVGIEVLYCTPDLRAELLTGLMATHGSGNMSVAETRLLFACLKRFSSAEGVLALIPKPAPTPAPAAADAAASGTSADGAGAGAGGCNVPTFV
jgi:hypothetical protein